MPTKSINIRTPQARWAIFISYVICLALDAMAILGNSTPILPPLTLFVLLYWSANFLNQTHLFSAFILGILADTLYQTTLGAHALLFIIIAFFMLRYRLRFKAYPLWQQAFVIGLYLFIYQVLNFIIFMPILNHGDFITYWSMPIVSIIFWPILSAILSRFIHTSPHH